MFDGLLCPSPPHTRADPISISAQLSAVATAHQNIRLFEGHLKTVNEEIALLNQQKEQIDNRLMLERAEVDNNLNAIVSRLDSYPAVSSYAEVRAKLDKILFDEVAMASAGELETPDGKVAYNPLTESKAQALMRAHGHLHKGYYPDERYDISIDRSYWVWVRDGVTGCEQNSRRSWHNPKEWSERYRVLWDRWEQEAKDALEACYNRPLEQMSNYDRPALSSKEQEDDDGA